MANSPKPLRKAEKAGAAWSRAGQPTTPVKGTGKAVKSMKSATGQKSVDLHGAAMKGAYGKNSKPGAKKDSVLGNKTKGKK